MEARLIALCFLVLLASNECIAVHRRSSEAASNREFFGDAIYNNGKPWKFDSLEDLTDMFGYDDAENKSDKEKVDSWEMLELLGNVVREILPTLGGDDVPETTFDSCKNKDSEFVDDGESTTWATFGGAVCSILNLVAELSNERNALLDPDDSEVVPFSSDVEFESKFFSPAETLLDYSDRSEEDEEGGSSWLGLFSFLQVQSTLQSRSTKKKSHNDESFVQPLSVEDAHEEQFGKEKVTEEEEESADACPRDRVMGMVCRISKAFSAASRVLVSKTAAKAFKTSSSAKQSLAERARPFAIAERRKFLLSFFSRMDARLNVPEKIDVSRGSEKEVSPLSLLQTESAAAAGRRRRSWFTEDPSGERCAVLHYIQNFVLHLVQFIAVHVGKNSPSDAQLLIDSLAGHSDVVRALVCWPFTQLNFVARYAWSHGVMQLFGFTKTDSLIALLACNTLVLVVIVLVLAAHVLPVEKANAMVGRLWAYLQSLEAKDKDGRKKGGEQSTAVSTVVKRKLMWALAMLAYISGSTVKFSLSAITFGSKHLIVSIPMLLAVMFGRTMLYLDFL